VRLRPERPDHVWAYDFAEDRTRDGRKFRLLCVVDEFTREALAIRAARKPGSAEVIDVLADLFVARGVPAHIRSDQGPEFVAEAVKGWIAGVGAATAFIGKASPWEDGYVESFNGKLRDELLDCEVSNTLGEAQVLIERWRRQHNAVRPHSALGYRPSARAGGRHRRPAAGPLQARCRPAAAPPLRPDRVSTAADCHAPLKFRLGHSMGAGPRRQRWLSRNRNLNRRPRQARQCATRPVRRRRFASRRADPCPLSFCSLPLCWPASSAASSPPPRGPPPPRRRRDDRGRTTSSPSRRCGAASSAWPFASRTFM
jgi:Integrase core domain